MEFPRHIVAVAGLISNPEGEILLIRSPRRGWEFPGGQVETGETLMQALEREVQEEAGITISVGELVGIYSNVKQPTKVMLDFLGTWVAGDLTTSSESVQTEWVQRDEALQRITHPAIHDRLRNMLTITGQVVYRAYTTNPYEIIDEHFV